MSRGTVDSDRAGRWYGDRAPRKHMTADLMSEKLRQQRCQEMVLWYVCWRLLARSEALTKYDDYCRLVPISFVTLQSVLMTNILSWRHQGTSKLSCCSINYLHVTFNPGNRNSSPIIKSIIESSPWSSPQSRVKIFLELIAIWSPLYWERTQKWVNLTTLLTTDIL